MQDKLFEEFTLGHCFFFVSVYAGHGGEGLEGSGDGGGGCSCQNNLHEKADTNVLV